MAASDSEIFYVLNLIIFSQFYSEKNCQNATFSSKHGFFKMVAKLFKDSDLKFKMTN